VFFLTHVTCCCANFAQQVNSQSVTSGSFFADVIPADADPTACLAYGTNLNTAVAGEIATFYLQLKDTFGNNYTDSAGAEVEAVIVHNGVEDSWMNDDFSLVNCTVAYIGLGICILFKFQSIIHVDDC
jgi:hypothetical protein